MTMPSELAELVAELEQDTGVTPTVEQIRGIDTTRWRLTIRNDRVAMTILCKSGQRGRYNQIKSTLAVDGQSRPIAKNYDDFVRIFNDPDELPPECAMPEALPPCDVDELPPMVAGHYRQLAERVDPGSISVGRDRKGWAIDLRSDDGKSLLRIGFWRLKPRKPVTETGIQLIVEGRDRSREVQGNLEAAMALMARQNTPNTGPDSGQSDGQESTAGEGYGSVGVRRHSVIRN